MATIRKVEYFVLNAANKPGEAVRALTALRGKNLFAFTGFPNGRRAQIDFIPRNANAFKAAAKRAKLKVRAKKGAFLVQGKDRPNALVDVLRKLSNIKVNVTACDAVCAGAGRYGAIFWVKPKDVRKVARAFGAK